jgi:hypothetical protein
VAPNPEAIAWYVEKSENLLRDLRDRVQAVRARGGQLAGSLGPSWPRLVSDISAKEVANYASSRFTDEPDLWRVHVRAIRAILSAIESTTREGDRAAQVVKKAEFFFLVGLSSVGVAFAILIVEVTL